MLAETVAVGLISIIRVEPPREVEVWNTSKLRTATPSLVARSLMRGATSSVLITMSKVSLTRTLVTLPPPIGFEVGRPVAPEVVDEPEVVEPAVPEPEVEVSDDPLLTELPT